MRKFFGLVLPLLCLLTAFGSGCSSSSSATQANYQWAPLVLDHGCIVQIGNRKLPIPITVKQGLTPIASEGLLLSAQKPGSSFAFEVFFPEAQENDVHQWAILQPANFPMPAGTYTIKDKPHDTTKRSESWWSHSIVGNTTWGAVEFIWGGGNRLDEVAVQQATDPYTEALYGKGNPLPADARMIHFDVLVSYNKANQPKQG